jgi:multiple sugar transport system substrate-binding protein
MNRICHKRKNEGMKREMWKIRWIAVLLCSAMIVLSACGGGGAKSDSAEKAPSEAPAKGGAEAPAKKISTEPVTLKVWLSVAMTDEEFDTYFVKPTKAKYPYITLEKMLPTNGNNLQNQIQAGQVPDIIYNSQNLNPLLEMDLPLDLRNLIKQNNFDVKRIVAELVDDRYRGSNGELYALPITQNEPLLWYNKSLFNKFGVPYPKDGMTWEESVDLTRRLTRVDGSVQYLGFHPYHDTITDMANVLAPPLVDPGSGKAIISPKWNDIFTAAMNILNVPGNKPEKFLGSAQARNAFVKDQTLAMIVHKYSAMFSQFDALQKNNVDFDMTAEPRYKAYKDTKTPNSFNQLVIAKTSKHQDQAFQVIAAALSDEVQTEAARAGKIPSLTSSDVQKQFGADNAVLKGKNIQALFIPGKLPDREDPTPYDDIVKAEIKNAYLKVYDGTDINTALRKAEEIANKNIAAEKAK